MRRGVWAGALLLLVIALIFIVVSGSSEAATITVDDDGPADYAKIQWAVDNASAGDTVFVNNGTYYENVLVNKRLSLRGENKNATIIDGNDFSNVVNVTANSGNISGFTVRNCGNYSFNSMWDSGIYVTGSSCNIFNNILLDNLVGIDLYGCADCTVSNNTVFNNSRTGIRVRWASGRNVVTDNDIYYNMAGIGFSGISDDQVAKCNFVHHNEKQGISLETDSCIISNNDVYENGEEGIFLHYSTSHVVIDNRLVMDSIRMNGGPSDSYHDSHVLVNNTVNGLPVYYFKNATNVIVPEAAGQVILSSCSNSTIQNLDIAGADYGILALGCNDVTIYNCTMSNFTEIGVFLEYSTNCNLVESVFEQNDIGARTRECDIGGVMENNTFLRNIIGLSIFYDDSGYQITNNQFRENSKYALRQFAADYHTIHDNDFSDNNYSIRYSSAKYNTIFHNNFINNLNGVTDNWNNTWNLTYPDGGNYWSDWTSPDVNGDGFVDDPYPIPEGNNADHWPFTIPNGWLPTPPPLPPTGDWNVTDNEVHENETINIGGTLTVTNGVNLTFINCDLTGQKIIVNNGGYLKVRNCTFYAWDIIVHNGGTLDTDPTIMYVEGNVWVNGTLLLDDTWMYINCSYDGEYKIQVNATGNMIVRNGSKVLANQTYEYDWVLLGGGILYIVDSVVRDYIWDESNPGFIHDNTYYATIQAAIDDAVAGDTVYVVAGTYNECLNINKTICLVGAGRENTTIRGLDIYDNTITITANAVNVSGFHIEGFGKSQIRDGVRLDYSNGSSIQNISVAYVSDGVRAYRSNNLTLANNMITGNQGFGIFLWYTSGCVISYNNCSDNDGKGFYLRGDDNTTISNNIITNNGNDGIYCSGSDDIVIQDNDINNNTGEGLYMWGLVGADVNNCYIGYNVNPGLVLREVSGVKMENCTLHNTVDITSSSHNNTFTRNNFHGTTRISWRSLDNKIYNNNFYYGGVNDGTQGENAWNLPHPTGGNYWVDWTGPDANGDGIVDVPRPINGDGCVDSFPWTTPNGWDSYLPPAPVYNIDNDTYHDTIQGAIDNASDGHTLSVLPGTYNGTLVIYKALTIYGVMDTTFIDSQGVTTAVDITSNDVVLSGFSFLQSGTPVINMNSVNGCHIYDLNITDGSGTGIRLSNSDNNLIENIMAFNTLAVMDNGIGLFTSNNNVVRNARLSDCITHGIVISGNNNTVLDSTFTSCGASGLKIDGSDDNVIYHNNFISNAIQADDNGSNTWSKLPTRGGNYWSDWVSPDNDGDGIVDNPRAIPGGTNKDLYPWTSINGWPSVILQEPVYNVDNDSYYITIQAAIDDASPGDTINAPRGKYDEQINISKRLTLTGHSRDTTNITPDMPGAIIVIYNTEWVNISGFSIEGTGNSTTIGIAIVNSTNCSIEDCYIDYHGEGVSISGFIPTAMGNFIRENNFTSNSLCINISATAQDNLIANNTLKSSVQGLHIEGDDNLIYHNNFMYNGAHAFDSGTNDYFLPLPDGGNYWESPGLPDVDGDGLYDSPYPIPGGANQDDFPWTQPWRWTNGTISPLPPSGTDWDVDGNMTYDGRTLRIGGYVLIGAGETLKLLNSAMYCDGIIIEAGGTLDVDPSEVYVHGNVWVGGTLIIDDSDLYMNCSYDQEYRIQINGTGNVTLKNEGQVSSNNTYSFDLYLLYGSIMNITAGTIQDYVWQLTNPGFIQIGTYYSSIQAVIDLANPGDTIIIPAGTYNETIVINKSLTLIGEHVDTTFIDAEDVAKSVHITANNVELSRFTFLQSGTPVVHLDGVSGCHIHNLNITHGAGNGIELSNSDNNVIEDIVAYNTLSVMDRGIYLSSSDLNEIQNVTIFNAFLHGILIENSTSNTIRDNTLGGCGVSGLTFSSSTGNTIYHNRFDNLVIDQALDDGSNTWSLPLPIGGNYWTDWTTPDGNADGIVDNPYLVQGGGSSQDDFPWATMGGWWPVQNLDTGEYYATIQLGIEAAANGSTIFVLAGTYEDIFWINKTLTLQGEDKTTTIISSPSSSAGMVEADNVNISGFKFIDVLMRADDSSKLNVSDCIFSDANFGVDMVGCDNSTIKNNVFSNVGNSITLICSSDNLVEGNTITGSRWESLKMSYADRNIVRDNILTNSAKISVSSSHENIFLNNQISGWGGGIYAGGRNNTFYSNVLTKSNFHISGKLEVFTTLTIPTNNTVDGGPVYHYVNANMNNASVPLDAGDIIVGNVSWLRIEGLEIKNGYSNATVEMDIWYSSNIRVANNTIKQVHVQRCSDVQVYGNTVANQHASSIRMFYSNDSEVVNNNVVGVYASGIELYYTNWTLVSGNDATGSSSGISLYKSYYNTVQNNYVANNAYGIYLRYACNNTIDDNNVRVNTYDNINLRYSYDNIISNNDVTQGESGVYIRNSARNQVLNNSINNIAGTAVNMWFAHSNVVRGNTLSNNGLGIWTCDETSGNLIYHNNVVGNIYQGRDYCNNSWDNGYPDGGNYWSDWTSPDTLSGALQDQPGGDGIVDNPYPILSGDSFDRYPLVSPSGWLNIIIPGPVYNVDNNSYHDTIQNAFANGSQSHTFNVNEGNYYEIMFVDGDVEVLGYRTLVIYGNVTIGGNLTIGQYANVTVKGGVILTVNGTVTGGISYSGTSFTFDMPDGGVRLDFYGLDGGWHTLSVEQDNEPSSAPLNGLSNLWTINSDMAPGTFSVDLTFTYDPADLPAGIIPGSLTPFYDNAGTWTIETGTGITRDPVNNRVTLFGLDHFTNFTLVGMTMTAVDITPNEAASGVDNVGMMRLDFENPGAADTLDILNLTANNTADADVTAISIWTDDGDGMFEPYSDDARAATINGYTSGWANFTGLGIPLPTGTTYIFISHNISSSAQDGNVTDCLVLAGEAILQNAGQNNDTEDPAGNVTINVASSGLYTPFDLIGYVYDGGVAQPGVFVTIENTATGEILTDVTDGSGRYKVQAADYPSGYNDGDDIWVNASAGGQLAWNNGTIDTGGFPFLRVDLDLDGGQPTSQASIASDYNNTGSWLVTYAYDDPVDAQGDNHTVWNATLYLSYEGGAWNVAAWQNGTAVNGTFVWNDMSYGEGNYSYYTIVEDRAGNVEVPTGYDDFVIYDTSVPVWTIEYNLNVDGGLSNVLEAGDTLMFWINVTDNNPSGNLADIQVDVDETVGGGPSDDNPVVGLSTLDGGSTWTFTYVVQGDQLTVSNVDVTITDLSSNTIAQPDNASFSIGGGFNVTYYAGWNLMASPLLEPHYWNGTAHAAFDQAADFDDIPNVLMVSKWDTLAGKYVNYIVGFNVPTDAENFAILEGGGYFVWFSADTTINFTGGVPGQLSLGLDSGWNIVGWTQTANGSTAADLAPQVSAGANDDIAKFNLSSGAFIHYIVPADDDIILEPGLAYFVWTDVSTTITYG